MAENTIDTLAIDIEYIKAGIARLETDIEKVDEKIGNEYVTKDAFIPVRNLVFGFVGVVMVMVVTALVYLVLRSGS
jgi:7-cyano-7-deazaguanine synthase in queuosine biosynthesis